MFLFIRVPIWEKINISIFKYISCFYLSSLQKKRLKTLNNLNTSHVFIYRFPPTHPDNPAAFKYISCFYLSVNSLYPSVMHSNLNTSHVFIYRINLTQRCKQSSYLNTSHVFIYQQQLPIVNLSCPFKYISCFYLSYK